MKLHITHIHTHKQIRTLNVNTTLPHRRCLSGSARTQTSWRRASRLDAVSSGFSTRLLLLTFVLQREGGSKTTLCGVRSQTVHRERPRWAGQGDSGGGGQTRSRTPDLHWLVPGLGPLLLGVCCQWNEASLSLKSEGSHSSRPERRSVKATADFCWS